MKFPKFMTSETNPNSSIISKPLSPLRQHLYDALILAIRESGQDKIITKIAETQLSSLLANESDEKCLEIMIKIRNGIDGIITRYN